MNDDDAYCHECQQCWPLDECYVLHESEFPDHYETLFPAEVLNCPRGHELRIIDDSQSRNADVNDVETNTAL